jgi:hypothetical protein
MLEINRIPKASLLLFLFAFAYLAFLILLGQDRAMDWGLTEDEMYLHEMVFSLVVAAGFFATWITGLYRAHRAGSWRWFVACLFFSPLAYPYTLFFNPGRKA